MNDLAYGLVPKSVLPEGFVLSGVEHDGEAKVQWLYFDREQTRDSSQIEVAVFWIHREGRKWVTDYILAPFSQGWWSTQGHEYENWIRGSGTPTEVVRKVIVLWRLGARGDSDER